MPATERLARNSRRDPKSVSVKRERQSAEEARFQAWLADFDARRATLTTKLDALLRSLGVDPGQISERTPGQLHGHPCPGQHLPTCPNS